MSHANAALTPRARVRVARLVVEEGWPVSEVAARFQCSWPTVKRRVDRYRAGRPMTDRSSRPRSRPHRTPKAVVKRIVSLRKRLREGLVQLAARTGVAASAVHRTLADGWAYARHYDSETQRRQALPAWLHLYNHHRPHTTTQDHPPITRLTNLFNLHT